MTKSQQIIDYSAQYPVMRPYSLFITTRHYHLTIRELFGKPKSVLPQLFYHIAYGADIDTIQHYSDAVLSTEPDGSDAVLGTKPDDTISPPDIFNYTSLLATIKSGSWDKFKWMFDNHKFISLLYPDEDRTDTFASPGNLEWFMGSAIRTTAKHLDDIPRGAICAEAAEIMDSNINRILEWLLFSKNTRDGKSYQEWTMNLIFYNARDKINYKTVYLEAISAANWNLARQILEKQIPAGDIQSGKDIIQPSLQSGMLAANREFVEFIVSFDAANGEWLTQSLTNNFSELENIIARWDIKQLNAARQDKYITLLEWYLQRYFHKYAKAGISNNTELGQFVDFTNKVIGFLTPKLWQAMVGHFKTGDYLSKYNQYGKNRLIAALNMSNLPMAKLLLKEYIIISNKPGYSLRYINIPDDTLISICGNKHTDDNLAMLQWIWSQQIFLINWKIIYSSARSWVYRYYTHNDPTLFLPIFQWVWDTICVPMQATLEFANHLISDSLGYILKQPEVISIITHQHPELIPKIWEIAMCKYNTDVCGLLLTLYPDTIRGFNAEYPDYFRSVFNYPDFTCWMIDTFPDKNTRINANTILELITQQFGFYKIQPHYVAKLLNLFPLVGDVSQCSNYIFHYANKKMDSIPEWRQVLNKICLMAPDKYAVILDPDQPCNLGLAQFEIIAEYTPRAVSHIEQCPICQFADSSLITSCGHQFCGQCINKWLADKKNCPYCRTENPELFRAQIA